MAAPIVESFQDHYAQVYNGIVVESSCSEIFKGHVDFIYFSNARNLSFLFMVTEFADLKNCEFMSRLAGYKSSNVWSDLKHFGSHEYVG